MQILYFCVKKKPWAPSKRENFFLKIGQSGCHKIQNFMLISDPKTVFRKNVPKKVRPKKIIFSGDSGDFFVEKQFFWVNLISAVFSFFMEIFLWTILSDL